MKFVRCPEEAKILASFGNKSYQDLTFEEWGEIFNHESHCEICLNDKEPDIKDEEPEEVLRNYFLRIARVQEIGKELSILDDLFIKRGMQPSNPSAPIRERFLHVFKNAQLLGIELDTLIQG